DPPPAPTSLPFFFFPLPAPPPYKRKERRGAPAASGAEGPRRRALVFIPWPASPSPGPRPLCAPQVRETAGDRVPSLRACRRDVRAESAPWRDGEWPAVCRSLRALGGTGDGSRRNKPSSPAPSFPAASAV